MNPILTPGTPPLRDALYALAMAASTPDAEVLDEIVRQYPQFADELTDFAVELAIDSLPEVANEAAEETADPSNVSPAVSRAMSRFHNRVYALRRAADTAPTGRALPSEPDHNPFAGLSRREFRAVASRIGANTVFVAKLRDRQIDPKTMTDGFKRLVANEVKVPVGLLSAHLAATPGSAGESGQFYKADDKPKHDRQQSFADAVRSSGLTVKEQRRLLSL